MNSGCGACIPKSLCELSEYAVLVLMLPADLIGPIYFPRHEKISSVHISLRWAKSHLMPNTEKQSFFTTLSKSGLACSSAGLHNYVLSDHTAPLWYSVKPWESTVHFPRKLRTAVLVLVCILHAQLGVQAATPSGERDTRREQGSPSTCQSALCERQSR